MVQVAPSLLSANFARLAEEIQRVEALADLLHVDIMDGHFVPNITMGPMIVEAIRKTSELPLDVHMMVEEPDRYLSEFRQAGADMMSVHVETCPHLERTIDQIHQLGALAGVALNPATPVELLVDIFDEVDYVLVMSVNPGFGGQAFWPRAAEKIRRVKAMRGDRDRPLIEVDGGINETTVRVVREAGVDIVVAGSYVFQAADPGERVKILRGG
ncbi:MAG: ribulose-phosphate 3-epimerase [Firmicutes bacterium]|nr:ribulose-phosphate 3-epimerase [Bacillota bacterium]